MYRSPITIIESTIDSISKAIIKQRDDAIFAEIQSAFGVEVDKDELIRALQYDRDQYDKGYADGKADLVHCKDCKHWQDIGKGCTDHVRCCEIGFYMIGENGYCYFGERKEK